MNIAASDVVEYSVSETCEMAIARGRKAASCALQQKRGDVAPYENLNNERMAYQKTILGNLLVEGGR